MKPIEEINEKIKQGKAVVVNAAEMVDLVKDKGIKAAAQQVEGFRCLTRGDCQCSGPAFQSRHPTFKLGIVKNIRGGLINRHSPRTRRILRESPMCQASTASRRSSFFKTSSAVKKKVNVIGRT